MRVIVYTSILEKVILAFWLLFLVFRPFFEPKAYTRQQLLHMPELQHLDLDNWLLLAMQTPATTAADVDVPVCTP